MGAAVVQTRECIIALGNDFLDLVGEIREDSLNKVNIIRKFLVASFMLSERPARNCMSSVSNWARCFYRSGSTFHGRSAESAAYFGFAKNYRIRFLGRHASRPRNARRIDRNVPTGL